MAGADTRKDEALLEEAREAFKLAAETEDENRREAKDDLEFAVEEKQWPDDIVQQREDESRPCLTRNLLMPFIRQVVNDGRQNRPQINVHPADDDADFYTAQLFSGLIRNIENTSNADVAYDTALEFSVSSGLGYLRVGTEYACDDTFDMDLLVQTVPNPFSIYGDPHGSSVDGSDWNSAFEVELLTKGKFKELFKGAEEVDWDELGYGESRLNEHWAEGSGENRRIMVANWWRREKVMRKVLLLSDGKVIREDVFRAQPELFRGLSVDAAREVPSHKVTVTRLSGAEVLEKPKDWAGRYIPIVPVYGHVINIAGKRRISSLIRSAKDAQRAYNYHQSAVTELIALAPKAPFIGPKGAFKSDRDKWETANTESHPYIEYDVVAGASPPQRQGFSGVPAGEMQAAVTAQQDMRAIIGMYEASLGQRSNETSGRAIMARQREGDTSTFHYIDNLNRAVRQVGRILIDLIPQVYTEGRVVRVLGADGTPRTVPLGQPVPLTDENGDVMKDPQTGQALLHAFDLSVGKYDLVVSAGPSFTTKREEAAMQMTELIRAYPAAAPLIGDLLAKNLDWPGADEIAKRLKAMLPEQVRGGDSPETVQLKQDMQAAQNELMALKRTIEVMQGDRELKAREIDLDARKLDIMAMDAETRRMAALVGKDGVGLTREDVAATVLATIEQLINSPDLITAPGGMGQPPAAAPMAVPPVEPMMAEGEGMMPGPMPMPMAEAPPMAPPAAE